MAYAWPALVASRSKSLVILPIWSSPLKAPATVVQSACPMDVTAPCRVGIVPRATKCIGHPAPLGPRPRPALTPLRPLCSFRSGPFRTGEQGSPTHGSITGAASSAAMPAGASSLPDTASARITPINSPTPEPCSTGTAAPAAPAAPAASGDPATVLVTATGNDAVAPAEAAAPQLPLCKRPAVHEEPLQAVLDWRAHMAREISELGDSLEQQDGGPDMQGLLRELDWLLDDVIQACRRQPDAPWEETSWRMLEPQVRSAVHQRRDLAGWRLRVREPVQQLWRWWERRLKDRVPFQYLISSAHWHTFVLSVGPGVLIPRPETEIFADFVRTAVSQRPHLASLPWADLGTGSGAIAIAAADELWRRCASAEVWAVDLSPVAVSYARFNAEICLSSHQASRTTNSDSSSGGGGGSGTGGSGARGPLVRVVQGSWFYPIRHLAGRLGGVLSNPPYIPRVQMFGLQAEVGRHEPWSALDGGEGPGLDSLEALCAEAALMLAPSGLIAFETAGGEQADLVADMLRRAPDPRSPEAPEGPVGIRPGYSQQCGSSDRSTGAFECVDVVEDCYGVRRFVRAYRRGSAA